MQKDTNESTLLTLLMKIFKNKDEYFDKKKNLIYLTKENTWEKNKFNLIKLLNEN